MFEGKAFRLTSLEEGLLELCFDLQGESVNKFNLLAMSELAEVLDLLETDKQAKGLLIRSGKDVFVVGADINEFGAVFATGVDAVKSHLAENNRSFSRIENLPFPTVVAIDGYALGGGTEFCLACDFRVASTGAKLGLPETKLGIIPGWGGTVRLPRLAGLDVAIEWISSGSEQRAEKALSDGVVDGVVAPDKLYDSALSVLRQAVAGKLSYLERRQQKQAPLQHNDIESLLSFESSKAFVKGKAGRNYPAPVKAIEAMQQAAKMSRDDAIKVETETFAALSVLPVTQALTGLFVADQALGRKAKHWERQADKKVASAAVLGAGIMGGGIAYQSAYKGVPVIMKDIAQQGLDLGMSEAAKLLNKRVERGRMSSAEMAEVLNRIHPTLSYEGIDAADIVVEAVVENPKVKKAVLAETEKHVKADTILATNTSTISVSSLAAALARPENFCGMHFFNPVHAMPLVEVIRGKRSSDLAIARTVAYANALGKKAVVVNDCPGFLVNRVLFPYFAGFAMLLRDGADYQQVDKVMERWGWPMGPAYLMDVVGLDTGVHAEKVMAEGFPDRLKRDFVSATDLLFNAGYLGQKNGKGFYKYENDKKGKPQKVAYEDAYQLFDGHVKTRQEFSEDEIVARVMVPMANELMRCLDENIVESASEADMALIYGLGFPPFRGGVFRWLDAIGWEVYAAMAKGCAGLGKMYELTPETEARIKTVHKFYSLV